MGEIGLDFDFPTHLFFHFAGAEFGFVEDFEGADEVGGAFAGEVDAAELSLSERFADFEHSEVELLGWEVERDGVRRAGFGRVALLGGLGGESDFGGEGGFLFLFLLGGRVVIVGLEALKGQFHQGREGDGGGEGRLLYMYAVA